MWKLKILAEIISFRDIRNAILGFLIVVAGLALAILTFWANRTGNLRLASILAAISLIFVVVILVFVVPPLAKSASAEVSQLDLPFEFTLGGALFAGLLVIVGFAAWNTGNNLLFLVLSVLLSALIISFIFGSSCLKKLDVKMRFPEIVFAEEPTPISVTLVNRKKFFPTISVLAEVRGRQKKKSILFDELSKLFPAFLIEKFLHPPILKHTLSYFMYVPRSDSLESQVEHVFENRGKFIIKDFELSTQFPFGFFRHRRRLLAEEVEILILPKISPADEIIAGFEADIGKLPRLRRGSGSDLLSLREYQPQDDLRRVDWKATAKTRHLMVRDFAAEDQKRFLLVFDTRIYVDEKSKGKLFRQLIAEEQKGVKSSSVSLRFEKGVKLAASLLYYFNKEEAEFCLITKDFVGELSTGKAHLYASLRQLAILEPDLVYQKNSQGFSNGFLEKIMEKSTWGNTLLLTSMKDDFIPSPLKQIAKIIRF
ncbi:MAG: hypothetical protein KatS3mg006_0109 [Pyrinomonadaceae bacterium]|jgi:uncharacterized protein (DUF58 family)|nr:MAG: hypothetical protein KatS3mg006_0109 [Pyrinomonadaceae bacterium]